MEDPHTQHYPETSVSASRHQPKDLEMTTVSEVMTRSVRSMFPSDSVTMAAQAMSELNVGVIPVCEAGKLVGMVTDRDIVIRAVAQGMEGATATLAQIMSTEVQTARADDDLDDVLNQMAGRQIRRMPVVDADKRLIGIISLGDIAAKSTDEDADVGQSLGAISSPAEPERASA